MAIGECSGSRKISIQRRRVKQPLPSREDAVRRRSKREEAQPTISPEDYRVTERSPREPHTLSTIFAMFFYLVSHLLFGYPMIAMKKNTRKKVDKRPPLKRRLSPWRFIDWVGANVRSTLRTLRLKRTTSPRDAFRGGDSTRSDQLGIDTGVPFRRQDEAWNAPWRGPHRMEAHSGRSGVVREGRRVSKARRLFSNTRSIASRRYRRTTLSS